MKEDRISKLEARIAELEAWPAGQPFYEVSDRIWQLLASELGHPDWRELKKLCIDVEALLSTRGGGELRERVFGPNGDA